MSNSSTDFPLSLSHPDLRHWSLPEAAGIAILISGQGSNMQALVEALAPTAAQVRVVISDRPGASGLEWAQERGIDTAVVALRDYPDREQWDQALALHLQLAGVELVVCAGFLKLLGPHVLRAFPGRIINTHNSLLPSFAGIDGPAQALAGGVKLAGATVFIVDPGIDTGAILAQCAVPVHFGDDVASLLDRIKEAERGQLVATVATMLKQGWYTCGKLAFLADEVVGGPSQRGINAS